MNDNFSYNVLTEGKSQTLTFTGENIVGASVNITPSYHSLFISVASPVAELTFPRGANISIQINKKLNWFQRLCYNVLGFKYRTL